MRRTALLQGIRKMRFEEAYAGWNEGRLAQSAAGMLLGVGERRFRRYLVGRRHQRAQLPFFVDEEGTASSFRGGREVIEARGLCSSFYSDRGSHDWHTPEAGGKADKAKPTHFGRALAHLGMDPALWPSTHRKAH